MRNKALKVALSVCLAMCCAFALGGCGGSANGGATKEITEYVQAANIDQSALAESYEVPENVTKVAPCIGALAQITCMLTTDPVVAAAPTAQISDQFKEVISSYEESNPDGYDSTDVESLIASGAQVAYGPTALFSDEQKQQLEDAGIIFIPITNLGSVEGICACTELIGAILGDDALAKAQEFTSYWRANVSDAQERTANLTDDQKSIVLNLGYSNGALTCESGECMINTYIEAAGGIACTKDYDITSQTGGPNGGASLSEEQIAEWNPDYIICYSQECTDQVMNNAALSGITAVREGHVYTAPKGLYLWPVRSGEGALMTPWLGTIIHPDLFSDVDMVRMTQEFFETFYSYDLPAEDASKILTQTY